MSTFTKGFEAKPEPISPSSCGLAIAVPLDKEAFLQRLGRKEEGNFAQAFCAERKNLSVQGLWSLYEPYARFARDVAERVRGLGVSVVVDATLDHFVSLLDHCAVVALVAQWRSALFKPADLADPDGIRLQLADPTSQLAQAMMQFGASSPTSETADANALAAILNQALLHGLEIPHGQNGRSPQLGAITRFQYEVYRRRNTLAVTDAFQGGAGVEFVEGFRSVDEIVARFPPRFTGLVDLTVCNSVLLAESIRRACPRCLVLANEDLAYLDFRLATYAQVIGSLSDEPEPYEDAVYRIRKQLQEVGRNEAKGRAGKLFGIGSALWRKPGGRRDGDRHH